MIAGYLGFPVSYPFTCETRTGTRILVEGRTDLATAWIIYLRGEYRVRPDDQFILDCGANIGVFALYAASISHQARIVAVEPFPSTYRELSENIARNDLAMRVQCVQVALSSSDGMVNMYAAPEVPSQARQVIKPSGSDTVSVPSQTLSSLFRGLQAERIDLLKMDIEGSEHPTLLAADKSVLSCVRRTCIEYHQTGDKNVLFKHLSDCGFRLVSDRVLGDNYGVAEFMQSDEVSDGC